MALDNFKRTDIIIDKIDRSLDEITPLKAQQGEYNGRYLRVQLTNGGIVEPQTADVHFGFRHNDTGANGIVVAKKTDASKGIYDVYYPAEMMRVSGVVICQLKIIDVQGSTKREISLTSDFKVTVAPSIITGEMEVAENSITVFDKVLLDIKEHERRVILLETAFGDLYRILNTSIPNMDVAVSTRASQSSLDNLKRAVDTKASQDTVNSISTILNKGFVKRVQRGTTSFESGDYNRIKNITISSVNTQKAMVLTSWATSQGSYAPIGFIASLTSATNLRLEKEGNDRLSNCNWQVVEFY